MTIEEVEDRGVVVIAPAGRVDSTTSDELDRRLRAVLDRKAPRVVVDLGQVEYISSAGLRVLLALAKRMREQKGALALASLGDAVRQVFELAGFLPLFTVAATRADAVAVTSAS